MITCADTRERLWPAIDGELDEAGSAAVAAHVSGCPACSAELAMAVATHRRLCQRVAVGALATSVVARRRWPRAAALAAALIITALLLHRAWSRSPVVVVVVCDGEARAGGAAITVGDALPPHSAVATFGPESALTLAYADGTRVTLAGDTAVDGLETGPKRLRLAHGTIRAEVAPQPAGRPMVLTTGQALAEVVGTRLALTSDADGTRLAVDDGHVRLVDRASGAAVLVGTGHDARVARGLALAQRPLAAALWQADGVGVDWHLLDGLIAARADDGLSITGEIARGWQFACAPAVAYPLPCDGVHRLGVRLRVDRCDGHAQALSATCVLRDAAGGELGKAVTPAYDGSRPGTWQTLAIDFPPPRTTATAEVVLTRDPPAPVALALSVGAITLERLPDETRAPRWRWDFAGGVGDWRPQEASAGC